jgi:hypothetical protein
MAAREAQIVGLAPRIGAGGEVVQSCLADATAEKIGWVRAAAGERFEALELNTYPALGPVKVTDSALAEAQAWADRLEARYGAKVAPAELLDSPHIFLGTVEQLTQKCLALRERFGISSILITGEMEAFAPVVERLARSAGSADTSS